MNSAVSPPNKYLPPAFTIFNPYSFNLLSMTAPTLLAQFAHLQTLMRDLVQNANPADATATPLPNQPSLAWYLGRSVYRELYWLREYLTGDDDLSARVRSLFIKDAQPLNEQLAALPPPQHLVYWAEDIQDAHLQQLATPGVLPDHPLLTDDRLIWWLLQEHAKDFERMIGVQFALQCQRALTNYQVTTPLIAAVPNEMPTATIQAGHYRIGSRYEPAAYDNELPPQAVELSGFRITQTPMTNAQFLAFIDAGGYQDETLWSAPPSSNWHAPLHWRRDSLGNWYGVGLNGAADLIADAPVKGISPAEASAFVQWIGREYANYAGAVLPHEYQWEVAARLGKLEQLGQVWDCCANELHPYPEYQPVIDNPIAATQFSNGLRVIRGGGLHTQPCLRRVSLRHWVGITTRDQVIGLRLVLPAE
ncbi:SUMF1/EgtB/PvdO family nonheme iron enzyme [Thiospirillum jenense]|uniref:SUMF1/EgtB/PvdO family nonheme iron enzyme n=1 Tax=Thiospirillum jenense TaxID=1653858 RepID=A0A839HD75_9GAMM|nr:SUMF1/EgtB/PvdO family nonheme iron enzyme [Thiospirillum jenense]MBB1125137.1 SUMF1/EgtB/PvdO family nonheme iron enzyme [Thiospirillum jenense]